VTVPDDAQIVVREASFRANKFILGPSEKFGKDYDLLTGFFESSLPKPKVSLEFYNRLKNAVPVEALDFLGMLVTNSSGLDFKVCSKNSTIKLNFENRVVLTDDEIEYMVTKYPKIFTYLNEISCELCLRILTIDGTMLPFVQKITDPVTKFILQNNTFIDFNSIVAQLDKLDITAVMQNYTAIQFVKNPSDELWIVAFKQSEDATKYVKTKLSPLVSEYVLTTYPHLITNPFYSAGINEQSVPSIIEKNSQNFKLIPQDLQTEEICKLVLKADITNCRYVSDKFMYLVTANC
jgi:hypothetical protein